jgi:hypothetical protein
MLNWMKDPGSSWWQRNFPYGAPGGWTGGVPGQFGIPADVAPSTLSQNVAAPLEQAPAGATTLTGGQVPFGTDQKANPNATMAVPPRQQLAQLMMGQQSSPWDWWGRGPNRGSQQGSLYGGYTTSGPRSGGAGGVGGWGWGGGARSSANAGGLY